jgi:hypothetical protein
MLSPALRQLFVELDKFDSRERTAFENDLHSELLHLDKILATARRFSEKRGKDAEPFLATLVTDLNNLPSTMSDANLGNGSYSTTFNTKCSKRDCPNKRKK